MKVLLVKPDMSFACVSVGENPDLCTSLKCDNKKKKYLVLIILATIIPVILSILVVTLVLYKRRKQRGKSLISFASVSVLC